MVAGGKAATLASVANAAPVWRGDLLRALSTGGERGLAALAVTLGMRERASDESVEVRTQFAKSDHTEGLPAPGEDRAPTVPIPFWQVIGRRAVEPESVTVTARPFALEDFTDRTFAPPPPRPPLVPWSRLRPRLLSFLRSHAARGRLDVPRLVRRWSELRSWRRLPRHRSRLPSARIIVLVDRSRHLEPFWPDQDELLAQLREQVGAAHLQLEWWPHGVEPLAGWANVPDPQDPVLALSDLGAYAGVDVAATWRQLAAELDRLRVPRLALSPCPRSRWGSAPVREWQALEWEAPSRPGAAVAVLDEARRHSQRDALERRLAPVLAVGDGLLRAARRLFVSQGFDAGCEYDVYWQRHGTTVEGDRRGPRHELADWRAAVGDRVAEFVDLLRRWHRGGPEEIWAEEVLSLALDCGVGDALRPGELDAARQLMLRVAANLSPDDVDRGDPLWRSLASWFADMGPRHTGAWLDPEIGAALRAAWDNVQAEATSLSQPPELPETVPAEAVAAAAGAAVTWHGRHVGVAVRFAVEARGASPGSPLGEIVVEGEPAGQHGGQLSIGTHGGSWGESRRLAGSAAPFEIVLPNSELLWWRSETEEILLSQIRCPAWADAFGRDRYGLWAEFRVGDVAQRMRWIAPGRFWMGSPEDEDGRDSDEGPRHQVTLTAGFWLADTPCTQELWQAVMDDNPSRFVSPRRPVEKVSWERVVDEFLPRLNDAYKDKGLAVGLPTEAQWEYACRAGTSTATYAGEVRIEGENDAPGLDPIAWYGGNSGVGFELDNGYDSSDWTEKQYPHERAGTRTVAEKQPNEQGLYDMLGNVLEWCRDGKRDYEREPVSDPIGPEDVGASRVFRGGSWFSAARFVRAAFRGWLHPGSADVDLGFRLSRGPSAPGGDGGAGGEQARPKPADAGEGRN